MAAIIMMEFILYDYKQLAVAFIPFIYGFYTNTMLYEKNIDAISQFPVGLKLILDLWKRTIQESLKKILPIYCL